MKHLYDVLKDCKKEEEVKSEFCKFFKMKINALKAIDHYTKTVLFEFKYDRNFKSWSNVAMVVAQTMYYARLLKFSLTKHPLPPHICVVDKNEAFFIETKAYVRFYASTAQKYDWDRAASTPCPNLVADIAAFPDLKKIYVYDLTNPVQDDAEGNGHRRRGDRRAQGNARRAPGQVASESLRIRLPQSGCELLHQFVEVDV